MFRTRQLVQPNTLVSTVTDVQNQTIGAAEHTGIHGV